MNKDTTFVITNFNTTRLLKSCLRSLMNCYPNSKILIVDNGSENTDFIESISISNCEISCLFNPDNLTHGVAMHQAMHLVSTPYVFFLDTDCIVMKHGFVEKMISLNGYAVGEEQLVDKNGINVSNDTDNFIRYIHPSAMLINRDQYFQLPPFVAHGAPCIKNMQKANILNFLLIDYPIDNYINHFKRGTRLNQNIKWNGKERG